MRKLYEERGILFAVLWIAAYCLVMTPIRGSFGWDSVWMLLISYNERIQHALSHAPMPRLGKLSMGIFVIHTPVYCLLRSSLFPIMLNDMPGVPAYLLCFALCISLSILGAWILHWAYDSVSGARRRQTVSAR